MVLVPHPLFRREPWIFRALKAILAVIGGLYLAVSFTPLTRWWSEMLAGAPDTGSSSVMVVLSGSSMTQGFLGESAYYRSSFAVEEYRHHPFAHVIFTGGGSERPSIARLMRQFAIAGGIPAERTEVEEQSNSTKENADFTARLLTRERLPMPVVLVTSDYHMFRSARLFERAGVDVLRHPHSDIGAKSGHWPYRWEIAAELTLETVKIVYYKLRGWI